MCGGSVGRLGGIRRGSCCIVDAALSFIRRASAAIRSSARLNCGGTDDGGVG